MRRWKQCCLVEKQKRLFTFYIAGHQLPWTLTPPPSAMCAKVTTQSTEAWQAPDYTENLWPPLKHTHTHTLASTRSAPQWKKCVNTVAGCDLCLCLCGMEGSSCWSHLSHTDEGVGCRGRQLLTGVVFHRQVAGMENIACLSSEFIKFIIWI